MADRSKHNQSWSETSRRITLVPLSLHCSKACSSTFRREVTKLRHCRFFFSRVTLIFISQLAKAGQMWFELDAPHNPSGPEKLLLARGYIFWKSANTNLHVEVKNDSWNQLNSGQYPEVSMCVLLTLKWNNLSSITKAGVKIYLTHWNLSLN